MIKEAKGPILWYLRACKFDGWTSFWKDIRTNKGTPDGS